MDWFILFNEAQIRNILSEYIGHYNEKRSHQGIAEELPGGYTPQKQGRVMGYSVLSRLHHHYKAFRLSSFIRSSLFFISIAKPSHIRTVQ